LSDVDGQRTPDDLSDIHDGDVGDVLADAVFGPALDWEGEIFLGYFSICSFQWTTWEMYM